MNKTVLKVVYVKSLYICSQYSPSKINYSGMGFQVRIIIFNSILQVIDSEKRENAYICEN